MPTPHQPRPVQISKALSRLLRHAAHDEGVPIDSHGYVRCDQLLAWRRLRGLKVGMEEIVGVVGDSEKMRFGLLYVGDAGVERRGGVEVEGEDEGGEERRTGGEEGNGDGDGKGIKPTPTAGSEVTSTDPNETTALSTTTTTKTTVPTTSTSTSTSDAILSQTQHALSIFHSKTATDPSHFFIRAVQGHSIVDVEAEHLLRPITLADFADTTTSTTSGIDKVPPYVVHGTFHSSWAQILQSKGLKRMGRNHVHFSRGPGVEEVLNALEKRSVTGTGTTTRTATGMGTGAATTVTGENAGDARDGRGGDDGHAELSNSTPVDDAIAAPTATTATTAATASKKAPNHKPRNLLSSLMTSAKVVSGMRPTAQILIYIDVPRALRDGEMKWWTSENGVVLTEGVGEDGLVGMEYWAVVLEVGLGLGTLWEGGRVVRELDLPGGKAGIGVGFGRGVVGGGGRGGRGGKGGKGGRGDGRGGGSGRGRGKGKGKGGKEELTGTTESQGV